MVVMLDGYEVVVVMVTLDVVTMENLKCTFLLSPITSCIEARRPPNVFF